MPATIGSHNFVSLQSPPPNLQEAGVALHTRPGTGGVGARVQAATGSPTEVEVMAVVAASARLSTQYGYRAAIGTIVNFTHDGVNFGTTYSTNFLVVGVEIVDSRRVIRCVGLDHAGSQIDISPAGVIISRWRLVPVPAA